MYRVLVTARSFAAYNDEPLELLRSKGFQVERSPVDGPLSESDLLAIINGRSFDALLVGADVVSAKIMKNVKGLKVISMHGSGLDRIDLDSAAELGITVKNVPGLNAMAVAELTIGLMICLARKIPVANNSTRDGHWEKFIGNSLSGKTLALIGLGNIGEKVARLAHAFEMNILAYDICAKQVAGFIQMVSLPECLAGADFLSLHLPLVKETGNLIDKEKIAIMKPGAYIINTSRGGIINENDLYESLVQGKLAGAALDVFASEPIAPDHPLLSLKNCIFTPHIGGRTEEVISSVSSAAANNIIDTLFKKFD